MFRTIQLLNEKNHFLEKFYTLNDRQIHLLESSVFDHIEKFYSQREDILKIIKYIDSEINKAQAVHREMSAAFSEEQKKIVRDSLKTKDKYVECILKQDVHILALIDSAKSKIIKELQDVRLGQKVLSGYKNQAS